MAAKGSESKEVIINKILETFPGAFRYDKELRIPMTENGETIQIKVALTCAKTNVECGDSGSVVTSTGTISSSIPPSVNFMNEPTAEEKAAVKDLCDKLGIIN